MNMLKVLAVAVSMLFTGSAFAGFYIEPGVTFEKGDNTLDWPSPLNSSTGTTQGLGLDLKLGFHVDDILFVGLDGSYSQPKFENSATSYSAEATSTTYGAIIGAQMPVVGLRIWGGYVFGGELNPKQDGNVDVKFSEAQGLKLGAGIKLMLVSINFEYMDLQYKSTLEEPGIVSGDLSEKLKNKVSILSVSFPLTL